MVRSVWKKTNLKNKELINFWDRSLIINKDLVGKHINIYNGKKFIELFIEDEMIGHKIGEFVITKIIGGGIHKRKNVKK